MTLYCKRGALDLFIIQTASRITPRSLNCSYGRNRHTDGQTDRKTWLLR